MSDSSRPSDLFELDFLHRKRQRQFRLTGLYSFAGLILGGLALITLAEAYLYLDLWIKSAFLFSLAGFSSFLAIRFFRQKPLSLREFVKRLSEETGSDTLIRYFDLQQDASKPFAGLAAAQLADELTRDGISGKLQQSRLISRTQKRLFLGTGFAGIAGISMAAILVFHLSAFQRVTQFWETFFPPNPYVFSILPGDVILELGSPFNTEILFRGRQPRHTWLEIRSADGSWRKLPLQPQNDSTLAATGLLLNAFFQYRFRMDDYISGTYDARVEMLPRWEELLVTITPPSYTGNPPVSVKYPISQFEGLPGSTIRISAKANKPLAGASIAAFHHTPQVVPVRTDSLNAVFTLSSTDTLTFSLTDTLQLSNKNPFSLAFSLLVDQFPSIAILTPEPKLELASPDTVRVRYIAQDDFGLQSITLFYSHKQAVANQTKEGSLVLPKTANAKLLNESTLLDLNQFKLEALDEFSYWLEAVDNDKVTGYKKTVSPVYVIRIAGLSDMLLALEERENTVAEGLEQADNEFDQVEQEFKALKESLKKQDRQGWDQQQSIQRMEESLDKVQEKVDEVQDEFAKLKEELQNNNLVSEETRQQYDELQQLLEEINDPAILKLLEEMQKGLQNIDQNQLRQALEQFEFSEERYRERLQRTMELLKSLQTMAELDKLEKRLQEMEKREQQLDAEQPEADQFNRTQESVMKELQEFNDAAAKLPEKASEKQLQQVEKLQDELGNDSQELREELQKSMQENKAGQKRPKTDKIQDKLKKMREKVAQSRAGMSQKALNVNILALKSALLDLIFLSEIEEKVIQDVGNLDFRSEGFTTQARRQNGLQQQFNRLSDTLASVAKEIPQFSNRILEKKSEVGKRMDVSLRHLAERDKNNASSDIRFAMGGINELASMLADLISKLEEQQQSGGEGSGGMSAEQMMEQMKQMSGQQQQLNQQMQDLINDMQGNKLNQSQMDRLNQMAQQQNEIRKKLKEIQQKSGLEPGDKILSELERLARQMEESINEMRGGGADRIMITRQQNILSRMLEVEKAIDQREEDDKRKGDRPKDLAPAVRPQMTIEELKKLIQQRLQNPNHSKYSPEFEELVRLYFELIGS